MADGKKFDLSLWEKYQALLKENYSLKAENKKLKAQLGFDHPRTDPSAVVNPPSRSASADEKVGYNSPAPRLPKQSGGQVAAEHGSGLAQRFIPLINEKPIHVATKNFKAEEKIKLFMSLFKGRDDVYAKRWQNKEGKSGYSPACLNEWKPGICNKPKIKCADCANQFFVVLNEKVIEDHLKGNMVLGLYPMCTDDTCSFLAIDFDGDDWQKDIAVLRNTCGEFDMPVAIERSRSGKGAHVWFFFEHQISAALARKFGTSLLTYSMSKRHEIKFKSYDRFFPNQNTMPKGGFGNLIAMPLQMKARKNGNSVFVGEDFKPYADQWDFLNSIKKLSEERIESLITTLSHGNELGILRKDDDESGRPWEKIPSVHLTINDFPRKIILVKADMIYILKENVSQKALNVLKRLAAFKNPEFFKAQAMRLPTYNKPRIISCSDETEEYLCLPRGCEEDVIGLFDKLDINLEIADKTNLGKNIKVEFNGKLREEQLTALNELMRFDNGVLSAATAFGKTIIAAKLISERKVSTLVLVHRQQLLSQWIRKLSEFLIVNEELPRPEKRRGRKKNPNLIGKIGGGKENLTGIIDVAIMQSLYHENVRRTTWGEVKELVKNYGMVIVDECHHVPAFSFEQILKNVNAKYVYGLTATPVRQDGHHPIIFMHCGAVRFKVDAKSQADKSPFEHYVIPRFTSFRLPIDKAEKELTIQELYSEISVNETRDQLITDDVIRNYEAGKQSLILTERTAHVELLAKKISEKIPDVITITGKLGIKKTRETLKKISDTPAGKQLTLVATGKYIGEGFDEPRLDTLFLAMPISWKGTLQQYVGRLNRIYEKKKEVHVYDYIDVHVRMLEKMYNKRLKGYASLGYKTKGGLDITDPVNFIYNKSSFLPVYSNDIVNAQREIFIVSPFISKRRIDYMAQYFEQAISNNVKVIVMTRPIEEYREKDKFVLKRLLDTLENLGIQLLIKPNIHQKFAVIDQRIVWYGSINLLSFGDAEESIMRLESSNIANELLKSI
ncbi:MAG: DEAD/DEAH box helicase family protein [Bacteroidota bacterium]